MSNYTYVVRPGSFASPGSKVFLSLDFGNTWEQRADDPNFNGSGLILGPSPFIPLTGLIANTKLAYTTDSYNSSTLSGGGYTQGILFRAIGWASESLVFALNTQNLVKSEDGGQTFEDAAALTSINPSFLGNTFGIYFPISVLGYLLLDDKFYVSTDAGATWIENTTISPTIGDLYYDVKASDNGSVIIISGIDSYYVSTDAGVTWTVTSFVSSAGSSVQKLSNTEYIITEFVTGLGPSYSYRTINSGTSFTTTNLNIGTTADGGIIHYYDTTNIIIIPGINDTELDKSVDSGLTFTTALPGKYGDLKVVNIDCGDCPTGTVREGDECVELITRDATYSLPTLITITNSSDNDSYGKRGLNLMQTVSPGALPLLGGGLASQTTNATFNFINTNGTGSQSARETGYSPVSFDQPSPIISTLWRTRLNVVGVWATGYPACNPNTTSNCVPVSFSWCITTPATKVYLIGMAADNEVRLKVDGFTYVRITGQTGSVTAPFNYWHVFPVELTAGQHTITLEGFDFDPPGAFGAEIYDISLADFKTQFCDNPNVVVNDLDPYIIFSTRDMEGLKVPDPEQLDYPGEWSCPDGFELSDCYGVPTCVYYERTPFIDCVYGLTSCLDPEIILYTTTDLSAYTDTIIKLEDGTCWTVNGLVEVYENPIEVVVDSSYSQCAYCLPSYKLINCKDNETTIYTNTDLSAYINPSQVIRLEAYPNECWQVGPNDKTEFVPEDVVVDGEPFATCLDCNPTLYLLKNCFNNSTQIISDSELTGYLNNVVSISGMPGLCFTVLPIDVDCLAFTLYGKTTLIGEAQFTGIYINGKKQYGFTANIFGSDFNYVFYWNAELSQWELWNTTENYLVAYTPLDIINPVSGYWIWESTPNQEVISGMNVVYCTDLIYDLTVGKVYPDCECCITKSCQ